MDQKVHPWPLSGHHLHRPKDRGDYYRYSQQNRDQSFPPLVPKERDKHRAHPDPRYTADFIDLPARLEQFPYNSHLFPCDHGPSDYQRPQSRHGYNYPPHSHWNYRENYGYYDLDCYRGQHGQQNAGQWNPQYSQRTDQYQVRNYKQDHLRSSYSEENRYDQGRDNSQHYLSDYEEDPSRENVEVSSYCFGMLESSKTSGLSSSSYELSQYINGAEHADPVPQSDEEHGPVPHMSAPLKYSVPHAVVSFGPAGQIIRVTQNLSTQKNVSRLEIHSLEVILSETGEQQEMRNFPGPLTREDLHKVDAIEFAHQKAGDCMRDEKLHDKSSAALLWNLLILLCRHNGQLVGSDIAELLMQCSHSDGSQESDAPTLIDFSESPTAEAPPKKEDDMLTGNSSSFSSDNSEALQSYTQLLLAGRKKEALESAMSSGLWGHALFLASKMNSRSYTTVLNRFTGQLVASDPLQTFFHLLSGRIPAVATCCGNEKSGDWRPHLSIMLSNETRDPAVHQKAIITMGDTLASRGLVHAAHMCYLTAGVPFGPFTQKAERLVLLGSSHKQAFEDFATNSAIQCTELYEYCQILGNKCFFIPSFQVYKFLYACRLFDCGLTSQAFHYCEVVGQAILRQREPFFVLTGEVIKLADRLTYTEGQFNEGSVSGAMQEPDWLIQLRARHHSFQMGNYDCTETHQSAPEGCAHENRKSGSDNLTSNIQSPEPELLYIRGSEDQEGFVHQTGGITEQMTALPWNIRGAQEWYEMCNTRPLANPSIPASVVYVPPVPAAASSQDLSYHNTDSAEVRAASAHCPLSDLPSAAEGAGSSSGADMTLDVGHQGKSQQSIPQSLEPSEQMDASPQQSKRGWFSGWFQSKPNDLQKETPEQGGSAQKAPPPTAGCQQPSSAGFNPFARKSGQQLG